MYNFVYNKQNALTICLMSSEYTKEKIGWNQNNKNNKRQFPYVNICIYTSITEYKLKFLRIKDVLLAFLFTQTLLSLESNVQYEKYIIFSSEKHN